MRGETVTVYLSRYTDAGEVDIEVTVRVYPAVAATGPSWSSGGDPPEPASGEVEWATLLNDERTPVDLTDAEEQRAIERALEDYDA